MAQGANRVVVGLPDRYEKAKAAIRDLEEELKEANAVLSQVRMIVAARNFKDMQSGDLLDVIAKVVAGSE